MCYWVCIDWLCFLNVVYEGGVVMSFWKVFIDNCLMVECFNVW